MEASGPTLPPLGVVALADNTVVGYCGAYNSWHTNAWIAMFVVDEEYRSHGLGAQLLYHTFAYLKEKGMQHIAATVQQSNPEAVKLYGRLGIPMEPVYLLEDNVDNLIKNTAIAINLGKRQ